MKKIGIKTALVSGGFSYFANRVAKELGIDYVVSNTLGEENSILTGDIIEPIVNADFKESYLLKLCTELEISPSQVIAVGDGVNDLKMLKRAGLAMSYMPKPEVEPYVDIVIYSLGLDSVLNIFSNS